MSNVQGSVLARHDVLLADFAAHTQAFFDQLPPDTQPHVIAAFGTVTVNALLSPEAPATAPANTSPDVVLDQNGNPVWRRDETTDTLEPVKTKLAPEDRDPNLIDKLASWVTGHFSDDRQVRKNNHHLAQQKDRQESQLLESTTRNNRRKVSAELRADRSKRDALRSAVDPAVVERRRAAAQAKIDTQYEKRELNAERRATRWSRHPKTVPAAGRTGMGSSVILGL